MVGCLPYQYGLRTISTYEPFLKATVSKGPLPTSGYLTA